ncbi:MAG: hypothetical protein AAF328_04710 [Planctomycetota bacterium]
MLYRLRCPRCGAAEDHAFVRPGAVTVCAKCHTIWRVEPAQVQRVAGPRSGPGSATASPGNEADASHQSTTRRPASPGDTDLQGSPDDTSIVGLSGLSEVMRGPGDDGSDPAGALATGRPAATAPGDPPTPRQFRQQQSQALAQRRAAQAAAKRRSRTTLVLLATLTVMVGSLGVAVALLASKPQTPAANPSANPGERSGDPDSMAVPEAKSALAPALLLRTTRLDIRDPRLLAAAQPGVRAVVELLPTDAPDELEPDQLAIRIRTTALTTTTLPGPIDLLLTASNDGRLLAAWTFTDPRDLAPLQANRVTAQLDAFPAAADPDGWIVTALAPPATDSVVSEGSVLEANDSEPATP